MLEKSMKIKVGKDRQNYGEEEEDEVRWMRRIRMRRDRFFRKCRRRSGEEEDEVRWMKRMRRMRKDQFSLRFNPSDSLKGERERERERQRVRERER